MQVAFVLASLLAAVCAQSIGIQLAAPTPGANITNHQPFLVDVVKVPTDPLQQADVSIQIDMLSSVDNSRHTLFAGFFNATRIDPREPWAQVFNLTAVGVPVDQNAKLLVTHLFTVGEDPNPHSEQVSVIVNVIG